MSLSVLAIARHGAPVSASWVTVISGRDGVGGGQVHLSDASRQQVDAEDLAEALLGYNLPQLSGVYLDEGSRHGVEGEDPRRDMMALPSRFSVSPTEAIWES